MEKIPLADGQDTTRDPKTEIRLHTGATIGSDKIGTADYNLDLSRRRAQAVQTYLVAECNVPVYRIQIVGLGKDKLINEQKIRDDRSKNHRVEVTVFSAESAATTQSSSNLK